MKRIISVAIIAIMLANASPLIAGSEKEKIETYHPIYETIQDYDFLLSPVSGFVMGYLYCGLGCAIGGAAVGAADEALHYFGIFDKHYLTAGMLGIGATSKIELPYYLSEAIGFVAGIILSLGTMNYHLEHNSPLINSIVGFNYDGTSGAVEGALVGIFNEITDDHYLNDIFLGIITTSLAAPKIYALIILLPYVNSIAPAISFINNREFQVILGGVLGALFSSDESKDSPLRLAEDMHDLFGELMEKKELDETVEKYAIALVTAQLALANIIFDLNQYIQDVEFSFRDLEKQTNPKKFTNSMISLASHIPIYISGKLSSSVINHYFSMQFFNTAEDRIRDRFLEGETALKLFSNNGTVLIDSMKENVKLVGDKGSHLLADALGSTISGIFNIGFLISSSSTDVVVLLSLYNKLISAVSESLSNKQNTYTKPIKDKKTRFSMIKKDFLKEADIVIPNKKMALLQQKFEQTRDELRALLTARTLIMKLNSAWIHITAITDYLITHPIVASKVISEEIEIENSRNVLKAARASSNMISWSSKNSVEIRNVRTAMESLQDLIDKIDEEIIDEDHILTYKTEIFDKIGASFKDFSIGIGDKLLIQTEELEIDNDNVYAITGQSTAGKSSFLSKLNGIHHNGIWANGTITYKTPDGENPKIALGSQKDYFPSYATLLELITLESAYDKDEDEIKELKEKALSLLEEIHFQVEKNQENFSQWLDEERNWAKILSGGQRKKLAIISVIMQSPDIAILDEIFNDMDGDSVKTAQSMLKKYLPSSLLIIVDHHAEDNNYNHFYTKELHFDNQTIYERNL